ncbi:hypothetical protein [Nonomuraea sp. NPDC049400]|uniref:hypothetical protein n=1 Tax=Nonomuraea sp. NPDC049400 TaxID=3364352 RepID=UPI00378F380E
MSPHDEPWTPFRQFTTADGVVRLSRAFPVVAYRRLAPVPKRWGRRRRDLAELPAVSAGTLLVAQVCDRYAIPRDLQDPVLAEATAVMVVSATPERIDLRLSRRSCDDRHIVEVTASYSCLVTDAVRLLANGYCKAEHVQQELARHLMDDVTSVLVQRLGVHAEPRIVQRLLLHIQAREIDPVWIPGLSAAVCADPAPAVQCRPLAPAVVSERHDHLSGLISRTSCSHCRKEMR